MTGSGEGLASVSGGLSPLVVVWWWEIPCWLSRWLGLWPAGLPMLGAIWQGWGRASSARPWPDKRDEPISRRRMNGGNKSVGWKFRWRRRRKTWEGKREGSVRTTVGPRRVLLKAANILLTRRRRALRNWHGPVALHCCKQLQLDWRIQQDSEVLPDWSSVTAHDRSWSRRKPMHFCSSLLLVSSHDSSMIILYTLCL